MTKDELIAAMEASVADLPSGAAIGNTRRAAMTFIEQVRVLSEPEMRAVIGLRIRAIGPGEFSAWLTSLPA